jgi:hypothetical protein
MRLTYFRLSDVLSHKILTVNRDSKLRTFHVVFGNFNLYILHHFKKSHIFLFHSEQKQISANFRAIHKMAQEWLFMWLAKFKTLSYVLVGDFEGET